MDDVNAMVEGAIGGLPITTTIEGRQRFSVSARFGQDYRNDLPALRRLPVQTMSFGAIPLEAVADIGLSDGPSMIESENAMLRGMVLFNVRGRDMGSTVTEAEQRIAALHNPLPKGYYMEWSGQWQNQIHANRTLQLVLPIVIIIIVLVLYFTYRSLKEALITLITVPFALIGGVFMVYFYGINLSVAVAVGFIALFGMAVETAMIMTIYLNEAMKELVRDKGNSSATITNADLRQYVFDGSAKRLRPKLMTVSVALFGLIPILWATGAGSDVMLPIVVPLIGGTLTSSIYVLLVTPVVFEMTKERELKRNGMHRAGTILFPVLCLLALQGAAQTMSLGMVLDSITLHHPALLMADAEIKAMDAEAQGARNWMPTQFGTGFNMTPYDASTWHEGANGMKGMGSYMFSIQQMFPKAGQLSANADYMGRLASVGREDSVSTLADLRAQAEVSYYAWLVGLKKLEVLRKDKALIQAMVLNAEQRYRDGSSALGAYYKATAAVGEADRMIAVVSAGIDQQRIALNTLMARDPLRVFTMTRCVSSPSIPHTPFTITQACRWTPRRSMPTAATCARSTVASASRQPKRTWPVLT